MKKIIFTLIIGIFLISLTSAFNLVNQTVNDPDSFTNPSYAFDESLTTFASKTYSIVGRLTSSLGGNFTQQNVAVISIKANKTVAYNGGGSNNGNFTLILQTRNNSIWSNESFLATFQGDFGVGAGITISYNDNYTLNKVIEGVRIQYFFNCDTGNCLVSNDHVDRLNMLYINETNCKYEYNGINTSISCEDYPTITSPSGIVNYGKLGGTINLNYTSNSVNYSIPITLTTQKNITVYFTNSTGTYSQLINWDYIIFENNRYFDSTSFEGSSEQFIINITYNSSLWNSISAKINYNGTNYTSTQTGSGDTLNFTNTIEIPETELETPYEFYWLITLTNSTGSYLVQTNSETQTISNISFGICSVGEIPYITFNTQNATSPFGNLNATFKSAWRIYPAGGSGDVIINNSYEDLTELNNTWSFCFSPNTTNYVVSIDVEVDATGYAKNWHYISNATYSNETTNITLYLLSDDLATLTQLLVREKSTQSAIESAIVFIQVYDIGTDTYKTVSMAKTNFEGKDLSYLNWYDTFYKFIIYQDGEIVKTTTPFKISETPQIFDIEDTIDFSYSKFRDLEYSLTFNNITNNFILTFVKPSALVDLACLRVTKRNVTNEYEVCNTCESSSSATIFCNIASYGNGTYIADFYATGSWYPIATLQQIQGAVNEIYELLGNSEGTAYAILFAGIIVSMFLLSPVLAIVGMIAGIFAASIIGFQPFDYFIFIGIAVVGGLIISLLRK